MNKEEVLKKICEKLLYKVSDFESRRLGEISADIYTLKYNQRGLGGIIIGDDGSSFICGSIHPLEHYIEEFKNGKRDSSDLSDDNKNRLTRTEIAKKFFGYHSFNKISNAEDTLNYLYMINEYLNSYKYLSDSNFVFCGRKKFVYDEIMDILNHKITEKEPLYFVLGSLEEFMGNNNFVVPSDPLWIENRNKNDEYIKTGYICLEEKEYIYSILLAIKKYIEEETTK